MNTFSTIRYNLRTVFITVLIFIVPFAIIFGAFSMLQMSLYGHLAPILAITYILLQTFKPEISGKIINYFSVFITFLCLFYFFNYNVINVPRIFSPITEQTINVGTNETVLVDSIEASFIAELQNKIDSLPDTQSILHIGNHPGIVYLLDKYQPGVSVYNSLPYFPEIDEMISDHNNYYYERYKSEIEESIILLNAGVNTSNFYNDSISAIELDKFSLVDSVFSPYLNRSKVRNPLTKQPYVYIYVPLAMLD